MFNLKQLSHVPYWVQIGCGCLYLKILVKVPRSSKNQIPRTWKHRISMLNHLNSMSRCRDTTISSFPRRDLLKLIATWQGVYCKVLYAFRNFVSRFRAQFWSDRLQIWYADSLRYTLQDCVKKIYKCRILSNFPMYHIWYKSGAAVGISWIK